MPREYRSKTCKYTKYILENKQIYQKYTEKYTEHKHQIGNFWPGGACLFDKVCASWPGGVVNQRDEVHASLTKTVVAEHLKCKKLEVKQINHDLMQITIDLHLMLHISHIHAFKTITNQ